MCNKKTYSIDVCKIGNTPSTCTFKERFELHYFKNGGYHSKIIEQCTTVGSCPHKKHAIMTVEELSE